MLCGIGALISGMFVVYNQASSGAYTHARGSSAPDASTQNAASPASAGVANSFVQAGTATDVDAQLANAFAAMNAENYDLARSLFEPLANQGNSAAQNELGTLYIDGHGVAQDYGKAFFWLRKSADQGDGAALYNLGLLEENGWGRPKDDAKAFNYYLQGAEKGNFDARKKVTAAYSEGIGVKQDWTKVFEWTQNFAADGDAYWQAALGDLYLEGNGVERNYELAEDWFRKTAASSDGEDLAELQLGRMYANGWGLTKDPLKAIAWYQKSAEHNSPLAQYELGDLYRVGAPGIPRSYDEALKWLKLAADAGNSDAQLILGVMYHNGEGVAQDYGEARQWYVKAAESGNTCDCPGLSCTWKAEGSPRIFSKPPRGFPKRPKAVPPSRSSNWRRCIGTAPVSRKTPRWPFIGIKRPASKAMPWRSTTWESCTQRVWASRPI
ncbi:MAG TPA: SEL1-like repeat protein [Pirellulales bacterium]|nr:SEL1-like repeat protein [Pirellulales bacterium]